MSWLAMTDFWTFQTKQVLENKKHLFECGDATSESGKSLLLRVAATHSGIVNGNMRFYRPDRMQEGVHTWTPKNGFPKPVLIGHNEDGKPLGRVLDAKYVDTSFEWSGSFPTIKDSLFYRTDAAAGKVGLYEAVDWIVDNLQDQENYSGLGYINLGVKVTNPDGIEKVLRDEYLTVSVGFKTDSAICSICHQDWSTDDRCEHSPGETVDGKKMFIITGKFQYDELSFVNFPADPFAGTISKETLIDSQKKMFFLGLPIAKQDKMGIQMTDEFYTSDIHPEGEMAINVAEIQPAEFGAVIKEASFTQEQAQDLKEKLAAWTPDKDADKTRKRSLVSSLNAKIKKNGWDVAAAKTGNTAALAELDAALAPDPKIAATAASDEEEVIWNLENLPEDDRAFFSDVDGIYTEMESEMDAAVTAGELTLDSIKDAKLSTEQRKKLKGSTFCGPNRSFPVPDCAHVTAARRLIGRAKVSADTKKKILSCVSGKASSLGCGGKDAIVAVGQVSDQVTQWATAAKIKDGAGSEALGHYTAIDKIYDGAEEDLQSGLRSLHSTMLEDWYADSALEYYRTRIAENDKDHVVIGKAELADKEDAVNKLTEERTQLQAARDATEAQALATMKAYKQALASQIVVFKVLQGADGFKTLTPEQIRSKVSELAARHVTSLKDTVSDILAELKWDANPTTRKEEATTTTKDKVKEPSLTVNDSARVTDPETAGKAAESDEEKLRREQKEASQALLLKMRYMSPEEQAVFRGTLHYEAAKHKTN